MKRLRSKLTYANVISTLALFLVLGGGAYAASGDESPKTPKGPSQSAPHTEKVEVEKESVGTNELEDKSISLEKLKPSVVGKIENIKAGQVAAEAITKDKLSKEVKSAVLAAKEYKTEKEKEEKAGPNVSAAGPRGAEGPKGATGEKGEQGLRGSGLWAFVDETGNLIRGSGVTSSSRPAGAEPGTYVVIFNRDVTSCAFVATAAINALDDPVSVSPTTGQTAIAGLAGNNDGIVVSRANNHGNPANLPFFVVAEC